MGRWYVATLAFGIKSSRRPRGSPTRESEINTVYSDDENVEWKHEQQALLKKRFPELTERVHRDKSGYLFVEEDDEEVGFRYVHHDDDDFSLLASLVFEAEDDPKEIVIPSDPERDFLDRYRFVFGEDPVETPKWYLIRTRY